MLKKETGKDTKEVVSKDETRKEIGKCISCDEIDGLYCMTCVKALQLSFSNAVNAQLQKKCNTIDSMQKFLGDKTRKLAAAQRACSAIIDFCRESKIFNKTLQAALFNAHIVIEDMTAEDYVKSRDNLGILLKEKLVSISRQEGYPLQNFPSDYLERTVQEVLFPEVQRKHAKHGINTSSSNGETSTSPDIIKYNDENDLHSGVLVYYENDQYITGNRRGGDVDLYKNGHFMMTVQIKEVYSIRSEVENGN